MCRWLERKSECPGSIVAAALDHNRALADAGRRAHCLAQVTPQAEGQLFRELPVLACLSCGATGACRASSFSRECSASSSKGKGVLNKLAVGMAPFGEHVAVQMRML